MSGIAKVDFKEFAALIARAKDRVEVEGFISTLEGKETFKKEISLTDLVPHSALYWQNIIEQIELVLRRI